MADDPGFEVFLRSKRIDSEAFRKAEPHMWQSWKVEFDQVHPASFTVQKLNLINAVRRKYVLANASPTPALAPDAASPSTPARPGKPVMKPRIK